MTNQLSEGILFGLGNPLLDISAYIDPEFLSKYGLLPNNAILADESHANLCQEMVNKYKVDYTAGGATQNSLRATQWLLGKPNCTTFMGCIGNDEFGKQMEDKARHDGVNTIYLVDENEPTGTCAVLITDNGKNRSLCAFLGASQKFRKEHLIKHFDWVEKAKLYYVSGFHLAVSPESILEIAKHSQSHPEKKFCMNLSAPYISQIFDTQLLDVLPFVDILFGNESEAAAFAEMKKWNITDVAEIALRIAQEPSVHKDGRLVVITQGKGNVIVAKTNETQVKQYEATRLDDSQVVDTNGAGDSFVGGFFAQYVQNEPIDVCIKCGIYAASEVIQLNGCTFPAQNKFSK